MEIALPDWALLLPLAVSLGASLYVALSCLSLLPLVPGFSDLPGGLELLGGPETTLAAAGLYLLGWAVRGHPLVELAWGVGNIGIRFLAVALLGLLLLPPEPSAAELGLVVLAGGVAGYVQLQRVGWMLLDHRGGWIPARRWLQRVGVEVIAVGILWLAFVDAVQGVAMAGAALLLFAVLGRRCLPAGRLAVSALSGAFRRVSGRAGWRDGAALPSWVRRALERNAEVGIESARATRAALVRPEGGRTFVFGWLVTFATGPAFLFRSVARSWEVSLDGASSEGWIRSSHLTEVAIRNGPSRMALIVPLGGPSPEDLEGIFPETVRPKNL